MERNEEQSIDIREILAVVLKRQWLVVIPLILATATDTRRYRGAFRSEESTVKILTDRARDRTKYRIVEPARVPLAPYWPDRKQILVMAFPLGWGRSSWSRCLTILSRGGEAVKELLGLPVLTSIRRIEKLPHTR
jgi:hypothetical protein